jgi:hypothetical protein
MTSGIQILRLESPLSCGDIRLEIRQCAYICSTYCCIASKQVMNYQSTNQVLVHVALEEAVLKKHKPEFGRRPENTPRTDPPRTGKVAEERGAGRPPGK